MARLAPSPRTWRTLTSLAGRHTPGASAASGGLTILYLAAHSNEFLHD
jgi:hypothetical protein